MATVDLDHSTNKKVNETKRSVLTLDLCIVFVCVCIITGILGLAITKHYVCRYCCDGCVDLLCILWCHVRYSSAKASARNLMETDQ